MDTLNNLQKQIAEIQDKKLYTPKEILAMGVIVNTELKPSVFTIYRLIDSGKLPAMDLSAGKKPQYQVKGKDLKKFLAERYQFQEIKQ